MLLSLLLPVYLLPTLVRWWNYPSSRNKGAPGAGHRVGRAGTVSDIQNIGGRWTPWAALPSQPSSSKPSQHCLCRYLRCLTCWQDGDWVNKVASQSVKLPISNAACKFITIRQSPVAFDLINQLKLECVSQCWLIAQKNQSQISFNPRNCS